MDESPNKNLSKALLIVNAPLTSLGIFGLLMWLYALISSKTIYDALGMAFGITIVSIGLWLEYQYYLIAFKDFAYQKEKTTWRTSAVYNGLAVVAWLYNMVNGRNENTILTLAICGSAYVIFFLSFSIIALSRLKYLNENDTLLEIESDS